MRKNRVIMKCLRPNFLLMDDTSSIRPFVQYEVTVKNDNDAKGRAKTDKVRYM